MRLVWTSAPAGSDSCMARSRSRPFVSKHQWQERVGPDGAVVTCPAELTGGATRAGDSSRLFYEAPAHNRPRRGDVCISSSASSRYSWEGCLMTIGVPSSEVSTTDALIQYRRDIADLKQRIKNRRLQVAGLYGAPILLVSSVAAGAVAKISFWLHSGVPSTIINIFGGVLGFLVLATVVQFYAEFSIDTPWKDAKKSLKALKLDLELAEERRILEARRLTPPAIERQSSYRERLPGEIARLRIESAHYRRLHLFMQWLLFVGSAAVSGVTAWYDPPQPAKGILIALGSVVTVVTAASGYFKPRERAFNLQQTADSMEQHITALELGIAPYKDVDDGVNMEAFATTVEALRAEQRMREQQLDQPQQGQREVI